MGKICTFLSVSLLMIGLLRFALPGATSSMVSIDAWAALISLAIAGLTFAYEYSSLVKVDLTDLWVAGAVVLAALVVVMVYSPTLGSWRHTYVSVTDIMLITESAIICSLAATRRQAEAVALSAYVSLAWLIITTLLRRTVTLPTQQPGYRHRHAH